MKNIIIGIAMVLALTSCTDKVEDKLKFKVGRVVNVSGVGDVEYNLTYKFERSFTLEEIKVSEQARKTLGLKENWSNLDWEKESQMYDRYRVFLTYEHPVTGEDVLIVKKYNQVTIRR
tara:strand:+ start:50 stop:403 length:354 start_codon:yes stop_codon:yes gene_type:complete